MNDIKNSVGQKVYEDISNTFQCWVIKNGDYYYTGKEVSLWTQNFMCAKHFRSDKAAAKELDKRAELILYYNAELPNPVIKKVSGNIKEENSNVCENL